MEPGGPGATGCNKKQPVRFVQQILLNIFLKAAQQKSPSGYRLSLIFAH